MFHMEPCICGFGTGRPGLGAHSEECLKWAAMPAEIERLQDELELLREVEKAARIFVTDSYRPEPKYDAMRFDNLMIAIHKVAPLPENVLAENERGEYT